MIQIFHIQIVCEFRFFDKKLITFKFCQHQQKSIIWSSCCLLFFWIFSYVHSMMRTYSFAKKLGRSKYDVTMTHYDVIFILFLFRFVANVQDLEWDNFLVLTMNRRGVIRIYLQRAKMTPQVYTGLKQPMLNRVKPMLHPDGVTVNISTVC